MLHLWEKYVRACRKGNAGSSRSRSATARASGRWPVCWDAARPASAGRSNATRGFPSDENGSCRPCRPKRLKTGPWTGGCCIAGPARRRAGRRRAKPRRRHRLSCGRLWARVAEWPGRGRSPPPVGARVSVTHDNGTEFARHTRLRDELGMDTCFADPYSTGSGEATRTGTA